MLLKVWYLPFCWYKTIGTPSALEKATVLILYAPYLFLSWLSERHELLPAHKDPVVIPVMCSQRAGWMQNTALGMLLMMLLKLKKTNFLSDWGNQKKGEEWGETPIVNCWTILLDINVWQSARGSVSETASHPGPCCYWAQIAVGIMNQKSHSWLQHIDMVPGLLLHLALIRNLCITPCCMVKKDHGWLVTRRSARSSTSTVQWYICFRNSFEFLIRQAAPGVTCWKLLPPHT